MKIPIMMKRVPHSGNLVAVFRVWESACAKGYPRCLCWGGSRLRTEFQSSSSSELERRGPPGVVEELPQHAVAQQLVHYRPGRRARRHHSEELPAAQSLWKGLFFPWMVLFWLELWWTWRGVLVLQGNRFSGGEGQK